MRFQLYEENDFIAWVDAQRIPVVGEVIAFYDQSGTLVERTVRSVRTKIDGITTDLANPRHAITHVIVT